MTEPSRERAAHGGDTAVHAIVLGAVQRAPRRIATQAIVVAAVLHAAGVALAVTMGRPPDSTRRAPSQPMVVFQHVIDLKPPVVEPPPAEPEVPEPPPPVAKVAPAPKAKPVAALPEAPPPATPPAEAPPPEAPPTPPPEQPSEPPPAAQAAQVVAAAASAEQAPSFGVATGAGSSYAGGTTASNGTSARANHTGQVGVGDGNGLSRARAPQLRTRNPPCGWPPEAEESELEEAFVTVRATVQPDGTASAVEILADPGYGFAKRMQWCIKAKLRFEPALDEAGHPIAALTPPIRVRFVRED